MILFLHINVLHLWLVGSGTEERSKGQTKGWATGFRAEVQLVLGTFNLLLCRSGQDFLSRSQRLCRCPGSASRKLDFRKTGVLSIQAYIQKQPSALPAHGGIWKLICAPQMTHGSLNPPCHAVRASLNAWIPADASSGCFAFGFVQCDLVFVKSPGRLGLKHHRSWSSRWMVIFCLVALSLPLKVICLT